MQETNLNGQSLDIVKENVAKLKQLFPEIVTEDNIDFDKLKAVLGEYIEKNDESYRFTWYGKREAFRKSQIPSTGTLRPCIEDSNSWDTTQNLYIEGDNLEVLKLLGKSYNNKIKMIYIDPPYNKDKDFIYPDKWSDPIKEYKKITGQIDEDGNVTSSDTEDEGGKHTKWLNMMYARLRIARNLLTDDGVVFISIDDEELINLRKLCDEVFGAENFVNQVVWERNTSGKTVTKQLTVNIEYLLIYSKSSEYSFNPIYKPLSEATIKMYSKDDNDGRGKYRLYPLQKTSTPGPETTYDYIDNNGKMWKCPAKGWRMVKEKLKELENDGRLCLENDTLSEKAYWNERDSEGKLADTLWNDIAENNVGSKELTSIFDNKSIFDNPKPTELIERLLKMQTDKDSIVLDFFSGSATTAHSVLKMNAADGGNRRFILIQLPEDLDELIKQADATSKITINNAINFLNEINKPHSLSEIGKERIRRAGESIKAELKAKYEAYQQKQQSILEEGGQPPMNPDDLDIGFKVFKLDNSNLKKWSVDVGEDFYNESKEAQNAIIADMLGLEVDNFVEGRSELDVVYEIMLKYGLDLTYPIETYNFNGRNIYSIGYGGLIVCLDTNIDAELADKIVDLIKELEPSMVRVAVRDLSFKSDSAKTNFKETLKNGVYAYFDSSEDKVDKQNQFKFITI